MRIEHQPWRPERSHLCRARGTSCVSGRGVRPCGTIYGSQRDANGQRKSLTAQRTGCDRSRVAIGWARGKERSGGSPQDHGIQGNVDRNVLESSKKLLLSSPIPHSSLPCQRSEMFPISKFVHRCSPSCFELRWERQASRSQSHVHAAHC